MRLKWSTAEKTKSERLANQLYFEVAKYTLLMRVQYKFEIEMIHP